MKYCCMLRENLIKKLTDSGIERNESVIEADLLIEHVTGFKKKDFLLNFDIDVSPDKISVLNELVYRRTHHKIPVQYILNKAYFFGEEFFVDENVLIPRPETELLVKEVLLLVEALAGQGVKDISIIDVGTGSGCIAVMLARFIAVKVKIYASDISLKALEVAQKNAKSLEMADKITFFNSDMLDSVDEKFHIIVSNPPYIPKSDADGMQPEVVRHEPHLALFTDDVDGLCFYKKLIEQSKNHLHTGGFLAFEAGVNQAGKICQGLEGAGFTDICVKKDFSGIERIITGRKE